MKIHCPKTCAYSQAEPGWQLRAATDPDYYLELAHVVNFPVTVFIALFDFLYIHCLSSTSIRFLSTASTY